MGRRYFRFGCDYAGRTRKLSDSDLKMSVRGSEIWKMGAEQNAGLATILNGLTLTIVKLGRNRIPDGISVPNEDNALRLIGKTKASQRFDACVRSTMDAFPALAEWIGRRPHTLLANAADWNRILALLRGFAKPAFGPIPSPVDIAGVDTKSSRDEEACSPSYWMSLNKRKEIAIPSRGKNLRRALWASK